MLVKPRQSSLVVPQHKGYRVKLKQIGNATLYLADAFLVMPTLGEVDSIITDPPYNPKTHKGARSAKSLATSQIDFDSLTEEKFIEFCGNAVAQAKRWVVEQTFGILSSHRRLVRDYEHRPSSSVSRVYWAMTDVMARRLTGTSMRSWRAA